MQVLSGLMRKHIPWLHPSGERLVLHLIFNFDKGLTENRVTYRFSLKELGLSNKEPTGYFTKAFITGVLNPKVALFFLAFVPQFVDPRRGWVIMQFILLGGILAVLDIVYESLLAVIVAKTSDWFAGNTRIHKWRQRVTGAVLIGLGVRLFFMEQI